MVGIWSILYHLSQEMVQTLGQSRSPTITFVSFIRCGADLGNHVGCIAEKKNKTVDRQLPSLKKKKHYIQSFQLSI